MFSSDSYRSTPPLIKIYFFSFNLLRRIFEKLWAIISVSFTGFWLGLLKREYLHLIDEIYYDTSKMYYKEEYNKQGLWNWEKQMIDKYFYASNKLLIIGVGGGREVLALHKSGYDVDGFECNPKMVEYANTLLEAEGITQKVQVCSRDMLQYGMKVYDGIIVGWGAYMSFLGKEERISLLRNLRNQVKDNSPILLSFFCRTEAEWRFKAVSKIGNAIRWILRRNYLEIGDYLSPSYEHYFTREEITSEMRAAGFQLALYSTLSYGHAVGIALKQNPHGAVSTPDARLATAQSCCI